MAGGAYCSRSASKCDRGTNGISERAMRQASHAVASAHAMPAAKETESGSPGRNHAMSKPNAAKSTGKEDEQTAIWRQNGIGESVLAECWMSGLPCSGADSLSGRSNIVERPRAHTGKTEGRG